MLQEVIFYVFSALLVLSAMSVVGLGNTVYCALMLVFSFVFAAPLWLMAGAEFLSLVLIFVYVGAVMTLFLFVVMMLDLKERQVLLTKRNVLGVGVTAVLSSLIIYLLLRSPGDFMEETPEFAVSNIKVIGSVLYTEHVVAFELAAVILLSAIVAAIALAFRGNRAKRQEISKQVSVRREDRVRLVDMPAEKKQ